MINIIISSGKSGWEKGFWVGEGSSLSLVICINVIRIIRHYLYVYIFIIIISCFKITNNCCLKQIRTLYRFRSLFLNFPFFLSYLLICFLNFSLTFTLLLFVVVLIYVCIFNIIITHLSIHRHTLYISIFCISALLLSLPYLFLHRVNCMGRSLRSLSLFHFL